MDTQETHKRMRSEINDIKDYLKFKHHLLGIAVEEIIIEVKYKK